jgi:hypothetical protein
MAITKILHMKQAKTGYQAKHLANGLKYITDKEKTDEGRYIGCNNCILENALGQMEETKKHFGKMGGRQGYHFIISFKEKEIKEETAFELVGQFVKEYLGSDYEAVYAVHNDTEHIHGHIIFNSVRCSDGKKYDFPKGEWEYRIQPLVNRLCQEHGLSVLDMDEVKDKRAGRQNNKDKKTKKPSVTVDSSPKEMELYYVFIPYRNRHLTRHQKECFIRKYRAGKVHTSPKTWEYRHSIQALSRLQDEYIFWAKYGIRNKDELRAAETAAADGLRAVYQKKAALSEEKRQYQNVFRLLKEVETLEMEAELYQEGYQEFVQGFKAYGEACRRIRALGYSVAEVRGIELYFRNRGQELEDERAQAMKEKRIARRLSQKVYRQEINRDIRRESRERV